jgi:hypothetical protein
MRRPLCCLLPACLAIMLLTACSKPESASATGAPAAQAPALSAAVPIGPLAQRQGKACDMVTQAEMSAILGGQVIAASNNRSSDQTECIYSAASGISPYAELKVEWGSGPAAMMGAAMFNRKEPGAVDPLDGLGDQAIQVGPVLMIRTGEDLVTIVFSGVEDILPKARRIFEATKARM